MYRRSKEKNMNKEFQSYFNLSALPFTKEIPSEKLFSLPTLQKALTSVRLLVQTRGIGMLTSESGAGKSCLIRLLASELNPGLYKLVYFCHSSIGILEFYGHLCAGFGLPDKHQRAPMFREIKDRILSLNRSSHIHPVLLLDDAHLLCTEILQEIRLLTNFEIDSYNALTVLLCGQESLTKKFGLSQLEPLANSIIINTKLATLAKEESFSYIEQRIAQVGGPSGLFTQNALSLTHQASAGIMRAINTIAQAAMMKAYLAKSPQVEAEHVQSVIER
jgi:type II secretory pathway predicted ATPase ExeA